MSGVKRRTDWPEYIFHVPNNLSNVKLYKHNDVDKQNLLQTKLEGKRWEKLSDFYFVYVESKARNKVRLTHVNRIPIEKFLTKQDNPQHILLIEKFDKTLSQIFKFLNFIDVGPMPTFTLDQFIDSLNEIRAYVIPITNLEVCEVSASIELDTFNNEIINFLRQLGHKADSILDGTPLHQLRPIKKVNISGINPETIAITETEMFELGEIKREKVVKVRHFNPNKKEKEVDRYKIFRASTLEKIIDIKIDFDRLAVIDRYTRFDSMSIGHTIADATMFNYAEVSI